MGPLVSEFSNKISKFYVPTDSEYKFYKARIENWLPIGFELESLWLAIRIGYPHLLGTCYLAVSQIGYMQFS